MSPINGPNEQEKILSLTDAILRDVDGLELVDDAEGVVTPNRKAIDTIARDFLQNDDENYTFPVNGSIDIVVSGDAMEAYLSVYPPSPGMNAVTLADVQMELSRSSVTFGVLWDAIENALERCALEGVVLEGIVVARGEAPESEIRRYFVPEARLLEKAEIDPGDAAQIDFKAISPFIFVKKGERLGSIVTGRAGKDGKNVQGQTLPKQKEAHELFILGTHIVEGADAFFSDIDGVLDIRGKILSIKEALIVQDNVDYHTGNIDFFGDVIIKGEVQEGFSVKAGGSVYAEHALAVKKLECGGDLCVKYGIIGRKDGLLKVGGMVKAKFMENTLVEAGGDVEILSSILRSSLYTGGSIVCGPRGMVIGGTYFAQNGLRANQVGSDCAPHTEIYCGLDYTVMKQLSWNKEQSLSLALALQKIRKMTAEAQGEEKKNALIERYAKVKDAISKLNAISANLVFHLDKNELASIEVTGKIYPGVYLEICHISYVVKKTMTGVRFILDKKTGTIAVERLG